MSERSSDPSEHPVSKPVKGWFVTSLFAFFAAALAGIVLRYAFVVELPIDYMKLRHAHGHMAMLGWVYPALFALLGASFLSQGTLKGSRYALLFWGGVVTAFGMFGAFIYEGYGPISLSFLGGHILFSYGFFYFLFKDTRSLRSSSATLLRTAVLWGVLSTLGVWGMFLFKQLGMGNSVAYHMSSQVFLHFQLTGWFLFAALAVLFKQLEDRGASIPKKKFRSFFWTLSLATLLTYALAVAWLSSHPLSYLFNGIGVVVQLGALGAFLSMLFKDLRNELRGLKGTVRLLYGAALFAFILKVLFQSGLVVPHVAEMAHTIQHLVIGFIHLNVLGIISTFLFGAALANGWLSPKGFSKGGAYLFLLGILLSELILFLQGLFFWMELGILPFYYRAIFWVSLPLPMGIASFIGSIRSRHSV